MDILIVLAACFTLVLGQPCNDKDSSVCQKLSTMNPQMCMDTCLSSICQRTCGHCPLKCYTCHEINDPRNCTTLVDCPSADHYCFTTQTFTDDFREVFKLGCAQKSLCEQNVNNGKRSDLSVKGACCTRDRWNNDHPTALDLLPQRVVVTPSITTSQPLTYSICKNMDDDICLRLSLADPLFCSNDCIASQICPRMCRKCFQCYSCFDIDQPANCNITTTCQAGKECFQLETLSIDLRPVYRLGCLDQTLCQRFGVNPVQTGFGRRQENLSLKGGCCTRDLCNRQTIHAMQASTTNRPAPTTTLKPAPTTTIDCSYHRTCPEGYDYIRVHERACYRLGPQRLSWQDASAYCKSQCGYLAEVLEVKDIRDVMDHLKHNRFMPDVWIGAMKDSHGQWIWSETHRHLDSQFTFYLTTRSYTCGAGRNDHSSSQYLYPDDCSKLLYPLCETPRAGSVG